MCCRNYELKTEINHSTKKLTCIYGILFIISYVAILIYILVQSLQYYIKSGAAWGIVAGALFC